LTGFYNIPCIEVSQLITLANTMAAKEDEQADEFCQEIKAKIEELKDEMVAKIEESRPED
jgi:hypothetical protein